MTGFVINMTGFSQNMVGFVLNMIGFVINKTGFVAVLICTQPGRRPVTAEGIERTRLGWVH